MDIAWIASVDAYLHSLEGAVDRLEQALNEFNATTVRGQFSDLTVPTEATAEAVRELETLLDERSALLQSAAGPQRPRSLRTALRRAGERERLARTEQLARRIEIQRQNAVSQFVTQYQLAETEGRLIRILTQTGPDPGTYGPQRPIRGGTLLDGAA